MHRSGETAIRTLRGVLWSHSCIAYRSTIRRKIIRASLWKVIRASLWKAIGASRIVLKSHWCIAYRSEEPVVHRVSF